MRPLEVVVGASDGTMTEVSGRGVTEGMQWSWEKRIRKTWRDRKAASDHRRRQDEQSLFAQAAKAASPPMKSWQAHSGAVGASHGVACYVTPVILSQSAAGSTESLTRPPMEMIRLENIHKTYHLGEVEVPVLRGVSLAIHRGEMVALMGARARARPP